MAYRKCDSCGFGIWDNQRAYRLIIQDMISEESAHVLCERCLKKITEPYIVCSYCAKKIHPDALAMYHENYYHFGCLEKLLEIRKDDED